MDCECGRIRVGMTITENRNWNPDCTIHGTHSEWWNSEEQKLKREEQNNRLRYLQAQAREARKNAGR